MSIIKPAKFNYVAETRSETGVARQDTSTAPSNDIFYSAVTMSVPGHSSGNTTSIPTSTLDSINNRLKKLDKLDTIEESIKKITVDLHNIEVKVNTLERDQREMERNVAYQSEDIQEIRRELRNGHDQETTADLVQRVLHLENDAKKKNIIMIGVPEGSENEQGSCANLFKFFVRDVMKITGSYSEWPHIEQSFRLGQRRGQYTRPILVKLNTQGDRDTILNAAPKILKKKPFRGHNVILTDDALLEIRQQRKQLLPKLAELRQLQKPAFIPWDRPPCIRYKEKPDGPWKFIRASDLS